MNIKSLNNLLKKEYGGRIWCEERDNTRFVMGETSSYYEVVTSCFAAVNNKNGMHVVNDIKYTGPGVKEVHKPSFTDDSLEGYQCDVLVIGGGISGTSILRELTRYNLNCLLVEKEEDLSLGASSRNDGEVHPGVDLPKGTLKQKYVVRGNRMFDEICADLGVPFKRCGQLAGFTESFLKPYIKALARNRRVVCGVDDTRFVTKNFIRKLGGNLNPEFKFGIYNSQAGVTSPYELTIAYGENAVENGAKVSLATFVEDMQVEDGKIIFVKTNRGKIYPKIVINAAGAFAEKVARMAKDCFYSIHPRKGCILITDKKASNNLDMIASIKSTKFDTKKANTKGGGSLRTIHDNLLLGPDAEEVINLEDYSVSKASIDKIYEKQRHTIPLLKKSDIITYFAGIRACTFEEDFIIENGRKTANLIHVAGIQSPGLTTAPAVSVDVSKMACDLYEKLYGVKPETNPNFNPKRQCKPVLNALSKEERNELIKQNPLYGQIICRCEEISKGEIIDCLERPIVVPTIDGIKRRIRPGMGRCQGGFCMPLVSQIIAEHEKIKQKDVRKANEYNKIGVTNTLNNGDNE